MYLSFSLACNLDPQCKVARWKSAHTIGTPLAGGVGTRLLSTAVVGAQEDPNDNYGGQISVKRDSTASLDKFGEQKKRRPVQCGYRTLPVPALAAQYPHGDFARLGTHICIGGASRIKYCQVGMNLR